MRKAIAVFLTAMVLAIVALTAWTLCAAYELRQAMRSGDPARIEPLVDWVELRRNVKATVHGTINDRVSGGWFRRLVVSRAVPVIADRAIDAAVTPERLAWFLRRRMQMQSEKPPPGPRNPTVDDGEPEDSIDRVIAPRRLRWAFFDDTEHFRIEISDPDKPQRRLVSIMVRKGFHWRLENVFYDTRE